MSQTCFICPYGNGKFCGQGCGLCEVCEGEKEKKK
jgi:hypothetical protein